MDDKCKNPDCPCGGNCKCGENCQCTAENNCGCN
jgi:hypothetical protein